jgi:glycosyltransferase involved in cell wall biosynthesis
MKGIYLGFRPPEEAAEVLASADALLVVMSFEKQHELFMRTSFTTKFLDYVAFGKPVILWGPDYCTPVRVARKHGGAAVVSANDVSAVVALCRQIAGDSALNEKLSKEALHMHRTLFNPDRLQDVFVRKITELVNG